MPDSGQAVSAPARLALKMHTRIVIQNMNATIVNGMMGTITYLGKDIIRIKIIDNSHASWVVDIHHCLFFGYGKDEYSTNHSHLQFPLRIGYGLMAHQLQGMTLDHVVIVEIWPILAR